MSDFAERIAPRMPAGSATLDVTRSKEGAALNIAEQALRVIASMAHEDVVEEHACRALRRIREVMKTP